MEFKLSVIILTLLLVKSIDPSIATVLPSANNAHTLNDQSYHAWITGFNPLVPTTNSSKQIRSTTKEITTKKLVTTAQVTRKEITTKKLVTIAQVTTTLKTTVKTTTAQVTTTLKTTITTKITSKTSLKY